MNLKSSKTPAERDVPPVQIETHKSYLDAVQE